MKWEAFLENMTFLASNYRNYDGSQFAFTETETENWYKMLGKTDLNTFKFAIREHIMNIEKPPTIASMNKMLKQSLEVASQQDEHLIDEQVDFIVYKATKKYSPTYKPVEWKTIIGGTYGHKVMEVATSFMQDIKTSTTDNVGHIKYNLKQALQQLRNNELNQLHLEATKTSYKSLENKLSDREQKFLAMQRDIQQESMED
ncbi:MAG: hypothetical protein ACRC17_05955 [Culicoidibacterales bacterium]